MIDARAMHNKVKMTTVSQLANQPGFILLNKKKQPDRAVTSVYCCDLLSDVIVKAPAGSAWVTVMGNVNAVAACSIAGAACMVVAGGADVDSAALEKAETHGVLILKSGAPVYETARSIDDMLKMF